MCRAGAESWTRRQFAAGLAAVGVAGGLGWSGGAALGQTAMTGDAAIRELMDGNERFVAGKILREEGPTTNIAFTEEEVNKAVAR